MHKLYFKNYNVYRNDRIVGKGGGTAILTRKQIAVEHVNLICQTKIKTIETSVLQIKLQNKNNLFIISAYAPGNIKEAYINDLNLIFEELNLNLPEIIIYWQGI